MNKDIKSLIEAAASSLAENYRKQGVFEITMGEKMPKRAEVMEILEEIRRVIFPGYFGSENLAYVSLDNFAGNMLARIYERLYKQVKIALAYKSDVKDKIIIKKRAHEIVSAFLEKLPELQKMLMKDVEAEYMGDPAANSKEEIIFCYPGIYAIFVYRIAHEFYQFEVPFIPRMMSEHAHSQTGIDINPGASIGEYFFIDHGTGIVIGETTVIGNHVKIYQGVTLGALSTQKGQGLSGVKRHPTIEDNVVIYANTTILGGETVVGENSVIAGNSFIIDSVPKNTKVSAYIPEVRYKENKR